LWLKGQTDRTKTIYLPQKGADIICKSGKKNHKKLQLLISQQNEVVLEFLSKGSNSY